MSRAFLYNLSANLITFCLMIVLSVCLTPYIVRTLGIEAFGLIHLTQNMVNYLSVITVALSAVVVRFFSVAAHRGDIEKAKSYLTTYLASSIVVSLFLLIPFIILSYQFTHWLHIPVHLEHDTQIAFFIGGLLFMLNFVMSGFGAAPFYANKLYVTSFGQTIQMVCRVGSIAVFFSFVTPRIWHISLAALIGGVVALCVAIYYFKKLIPWFEFKWRHVSFSSGIELVRSGIWNSFEQMGVLLFLQIDLFMANLLLGAGEAGKYAAILQFPLLLRTLAGTLAVVFAPTITKYYSAGDEEGLVQYAAKAIKLNGLFIAFPAALLGGLSGPLITIWLGPSYQNLQWLLMIHAAYLVMTLMFLPLTYVPTAFNRFKIPAVVTLLLGILNVLLAYGLSSNAQLGLYGIALAGAFVLMVKNLFFLPLYTAKVTGKRSLIFYKNTCVPLVGALLVWGVCTLIQLVYSLSTWWELFGIAGICTGIYGIYLYRFAGTKQERAKLIQKVKQVTGHHTVTR
ncbi:MATE family efflux transporter [Bacillus sp. NPDC077027]|uniref:MATE family efflux transporter n=1 Tax=Bacillus sp. NPDC077027 TaxID=3390548 RepID=UPI003D02D55F